MTIWIGTGSWEGWKLTTCPTNSDDQPVLVDPDGTVYGPNDILSFSQVMSGPEAAETWGVAESTVRNYANSGRFLPSEARHSGKVWLITRQGMRRAFGGLRS